jgi:hypothetical protein
MTAFGSRGLASSAWISDVMVLTKVRVNHSWLGALFLALPCMRRFFPTGVRCYKLCSALALSLVVPQWQIRFSSRITTGK